MPQGGKCNCDDNKSTTESTSPAKCIKTPPTPGQTSEIRCSCGPPSSKCPEKPEGEKMPVIPQKEARRFMYDCLVAAGASPENASIQADMMIYADIRGIVSDGMNHLEMYCIKLKNKKIIGKEAPEIISEAPSCAFVDGKHALGAAVGCFCMDLAIKKSKLNGIGFVVCKNSSNYGCATFYSDRAIKNGLIGISYSNSPATVVPPRANESAIGSNALGFSAPISFADSIGLNIAVSAASIGKVEMKYKEKQCLPVGWAEIDGNPVTDPEWVMNHGGLIPLGGTEETGGHKGFGIALMIDILTGILSGSDFGPKVSNEKEYSFLSQCFMAINPEMFATGFSERMRWMAHFIRNMTPAVEGKPVLMPGDPGKKCMEATDLGGGITYLKAQMGQCQRLADDFKVKPLGEAKPNV